MLRAERQQQRVFGRRRLQLEVELTAEALAQRERPRLVDAAAERRVQHQLHAARFVEEALEHERLLRRDDAERRAPVERDSSPPVRRRPGTSPVSAMNQSTSGAALGSRSESPRREDRDTARESSSLRAGASPSQNGIVGGAPCASRTRTVPATTCVICHDALPSWKMSPPLLSMAKSSLSVPTNVSSGSTTTR